MSHNKDVASMGASYSESEVTCPWCGYEHSDSWEFSDGDYDCADCEKPFGVSRDESVTYSTVRREERR